MTEKQAWLVIAEAYATEYEDRTGKQLRLSDSGLCSAVECLPTTEPVYCSMQKKIKQCLLIDRERWNGRVWFLPVRAFSEIILFKPEYDHLRADFCYLMHYSCGGE